KAKPLLDVAGKPMVAWVVDNLRDVAEIETIYIVTNAKFFADFEAWAKNYQSKNPNFPFKVINDGSTTDDNKLGAIGDINLVLTSENAADSDLLGIAGGVCGLRQANRGNRRCASRGRWRSDPEVRRRHNRCRRNHHSFRRKTEGTKKQPGSDRLVFLFEGHAAAFHDLHRGGK